MSWAEHQVTLRLEAEEFVLFLAVGPGRRQVFNEYFHSSPAVWRDGPAAGGVGRGWGGAEKWAERDAEWGANKASGGGGVKGSAGADRTAGAGRVRVAPAERA